ncbi:MAG: hypothetical protein MUF15_04875 [Acidobacteria bacterium]|jgi:hypothetical protein|nr:hypothetical protein [Acidobacteriota bacterium]
MKIKALVMLSVCFIFVIGMSLMAQTNDTVTINAEIRGHLTFILDGTDAGSSLPGGNYSAAETCDFGVLDAGGGAITGGDALVTGQTGLPVDASGADLSGGDGFFDANCVGAFYQFFSAIGAPTRTNHDTAAIGIYAKGSHVTTYDLTVSAAVVGDASVTVGQLKWKSNAGAYATYASFTAAPVSITSGGPSHIDLMLYHDYGLVIEYADVIGSYTWTVTYTMTTT